MRLTDTVERTAELNGRTVPYRFRVSARARHMRISVGPEGVLLVAPQRMPPDRAEGFLHQHAAWVLAKLDLHARRAAHRPAMRLPPGTVLYRGLPLRWEATGPLFAGFAATPEPILRVAALPGHAGAKVEAWLKLRAREEIEARVRARAAEMGVRVERVALRDPRSRWGSCSRQGGLSFSWRLIMAPPEVLDYVVVHELAHRVEMNHGARYWQLVARHCPAHKAHRAWLRRHQGLLHRAIAQPITSQPAAGRA